MSYRAQFLEKKVVFPSYEEAEKWVIYQVQGKPVGTGEGTIVHKGEILAYYKKVSVNAFVNVEKTWEEDGESCNCLVGRWI